MRLRIWLILGFLSLTLVCLAGFEFRYAWFQSNWVSDYADRLHYQLGDGQSSAIHFPESGPFDRRLGYSQIPQWQPRLLRQGYDVVRQTQFSDELLEYAQRGLFIPYDEKTHAGLQVADARGELIYQFAYPRFRFAEFDDIPALLVDSLLFIEDRHLLDRNLPRANPAVDWPRLAGASMSMLVGTLGGSGPSHGASTLATQMEKFRHSLEGRTQTPLDKLRQMTSATVRAYRHGPETLQARQQLVRDYLNTVPLSAAPGYGEVHGIGDGLRVWFAEDAQRFAANLNGEQGLDEQAVALRQALSLIIAQRRPSWYLLDGRGELHTLVDSHVSLLASHGRIDGELAQAALRTQVRFRDWQAQPLLELTAADKAAWVTRNQLVSLLGQSAYDLDRLDLRVQSTLDAGLQRRVGDFLEALADEVAASEAGLLGERLLSPRQAAQVRYSFTLMERTPTGNKVRVQTDTNGLPFDLNSGSKLELGSTAKLRVLTSYLEIMAELHAELAGADTQTLQEARARRGDPLTIWAADYLRGNPQAPLSQMLDAALQRRYSASPHEPFFTGSGVQHFSNFRKEDNTRRVSVQQALQESINLPYVRLLRDVVRFSLHQQVDDATSLLTNDRDPRREAYLQTFADREGRVYLQRFWRRYAGMDEQQRFEHLLSQVQPIAARLAVVYRTLYPQADLETFRGFIEAHVRVPQTPQRIERLYGTYAPGSFNLNDQGYIAKVHPLELWLLGYLQQHPEATLSDMLSASAVERQEVYSWLFRTRHASARNTRIRIMLEREAFAALHQRWQRLGYPFPHLVPSLGTALGSSGDRPSALAELMGIILNDGKRIGVQRLTSLHFAADTPWETRFEPAAMQAQQVLHPEVAAALRNALSAVVLDGTGRRLQGVFHGADGEPLLIGGKTGTGDNRMYTVTRTGAVISSEVMNRTATFVFFIGPNHFGTLTAFVPGEDAEAFHFTSALPAQVLKSMAPVLTPHLTPLGDADPLQAQLSP
ncbi:MAG: transglycosylase domain-containing protein [Pseudomonas sp.]